MLGALVHIEQGFLGKLEATHITAELGHAFKPLEVAVEGLLGEGEGAAGRAHLVLHLQPKQQSYQG